MNTDTDTLWESIKGTTEERLRLNEALRDKERLVWLGRPAPKLCTVQRLLPIPFFTGFALFWASGLWLLTRDVFTGSVTLPMVLFLIPFFPVPFVVLSIGFSGLWEARQLRRSVYALTDHRALVLRKTLFGYKLSHWAANAYGDTLRRKDGSGDIVYETEERRAGRGGVHGFTELPDVESVVALLGTLAPTADEALPQDEEQPTSPKVTIIRAVFLGLVSLLLLGVAGILFSAGITESNTYLAVKGTITAVEKERHQSHGRHGSSSSTTYTPHYRYTVQNRVYKAKAPISSSTYSDCRVGDSISLIYPPDRPQDAIPDDFTSRWSLPSFLTFIGLGFGAGAVVPLIVARRKKKDGQALQPTDR